MTTTVRDLLDLLSDFDPDTEVRIAYQESWPLAATIAGVRELRGDDDDDDERFWVCQNEGCSADAEYEIPMKCKTCGCETLPVGDDPADNDAKPIVWIAAGGHPGGYDDSPYAPKAAWNE